MNNAHWGGEMAKFKDMRFQRAGVGDVTDLSSESLELLRAFDGIASISEIRTRVKLDSTTFKECFLELFKKRFIAEADFSTADVVESSEHLDASFLEIIIKEVVAVAGPMGELLVSDVLDELGLDPDQIPVSKKDALISAISENIPGEKQRKQFLDRCS